MAEQQGLRLLIEQTDQFIAENPSVIDVVRPTRTEDGAGGTIATPTALPAQTVRLVPLAPSTSVERRTVDGEVVTTVYSVVANPEVDLREGDYFPINGARHEVVLAIDIGGYELRAEVARRG